MDNALHLTRWTWLFLGALGYVAWAINAALEGSSAFSIMAGGLLIGLWVLVTIAVDRWVIMGASHHQ
jgi:hypothetical protein